MRDEPECREGPFRLRRDVVTCASRGRLYAEPPSATRTEFQRDRDRIIHCGAFRRLAGKTQVFLPDEGDHYRTRLTHTIEVAQISRSIARVLGLDDDLTEALALAHDLGHAPFGHTGEDALNQAFAGSGGFDHNAQTLRIVTCLEKRYPAFDGLNLTRETLEGLVKRKGPLRGPAGGDAERQPLPPIFARLAADLELPLATHARPEAQVAAISDEIAYNAHDLEDGLDAGLFDLPDLADVPLLADMLESVGADLTGVDRDLMIRALIRSLVGGFVEDVIAESSRRLGQGHRFPVEQPVIALSGEMAAASAAMKLFLRERMYGHPRLLAVRSRAFAIMTDLADRLTSDPSGIPVARAGQDPGSDGSPGVRPVVDYLAGLTDRGAVAEHRRLFGSTPDLR